MSGADPAAPLPPALPLGAEQKLRRWIVELVAEPGLTAVQDAGAAWRVHVEDALAGAGLVAAIGGPLVDVGSGGGAPGIPLAAAFPERDVVLVEASRRKCSFLERWCEAFPNARVLCARAEEVPREGFGVAVARALAPPAVAAEWCLPLVRRGGAVILYIGAPDASLESAARALAAEPPELYGVPGAAGKTLALLRKREPTPARFPRRVGVARKRPLA